MISAPVIFNKQCTYLISKAWYLLRSCHNMAEITLKRSKLLNYSNPTRSTSLCILCCISMKFADPIPRPPIPASPPSGPKPNGVWLTSGAEGWKYTELHEHPCLIGEGITYCICNVQVRNFYCHIHMYSVSGLTYIFLYFEISSDLFLSLDIA